MAQLRVRLEWLTGLNRPIFQNVRLAGSWDEGGRYSDQWHSVPMTPFTAPDGCPAWFAEVSFDEAQRGWTFHWGVVVDAPQRVEVWGIATEVPDSFSTAQHRDFVLDQNGQIERYWLTHGRRLGANKVWRDGAANPAIRFAVWAPNARSVGLVTGDPGSGYIWSDERGVRRSFALVRDAGGPGIWASNPADPAFADFSAWDHVPYMFRIEKDDGTIAFRTDLYSRCQIGAGRKDPENPPKDEPPWNGTAQDLDGVKGCSVVIDAETVTERIDDTDFPPRRMVPEADFWANEYDPLRPVPTRLDELIIYEMHVGGLGVHRRDAAGTPLPGSFIDAIALLDHLVALGVNAVELMPATEAEGWTWGYGSSHYFATEYSAGGRDLFKHFVRACHQRGIAVLMDVVYNHYSFDAERAESLYDSNTHSKDIYYWYEGRDSDWSNPSGGYLQNGSSGRAPNYRSELVRKMFISSAVMLMTEFHVDGFRVDLTQSFHRDNNIEANGAPVPEANRLGTKFLREWVRALRLVKPSVMLTAEDHTGWSAITQPQETGGIGFDAIWWAEWYHHIIGDSQNDSHNARLLYVAGFGGNDPLAMSYVAGALQATPGRVIYHEPHDQAGNAAYWVGDYQVHSARTIQTAVNWNLNGTRFWAEARCRVVSGLTLLAPGVPMFFMGEEVGAQEPYRYTDWLYHREDFQALRATSGAKLFRFYRDVIRLRRRYAALTSPHVEILHVHDANRVLAFRRWLADAEFLVFVSLNNSAFTDGYWIGHPALRDGAFIEVLNSDAEIYGGLGVTNPGTHYTGGSAGSMRRCRPTASLFSSGFDGRAAGTAKPRMAAIARSEKHLTEETRVIHQFIFAGPKPGLTADAFTSYWINFHAVDFAAKIKQIRQYLVAARLPVATGRDVPAHLQGVAEIWLKNQAEQLASLQSPEFLQGARLDEPRWAAFWLTLVLDTESQVLTEHQGPAPAPEFIKIYTLLKRKPDLALEEFRRQLIDDRSDLSKHYQFARHLVGFSRDALYGFGEPAFDAVEVIALADLPALEALLADQNFAVALTKRPYVHDTYAFNFVAREHWIIRPGER